MAGKKKVVTQTASWMSGAGAQSRKIWLAGLGAYAKAETEGREAFDALVSAGQQVQQEQLQLDAAKQALATQTLKSPKASKAVVGKAKRVAPVADIAPLAEATGEVSVAKPVSAKPIAAKPIAAKAVAAETVAKSAKKAAKATKPAEKLAEPVVAEKKPKTRKAAVKA